LYSLASRIADTVVFILYIMTMTTGPQLAELHAKQDRRGMQQLITHSTVAISAWAIPVALALIVAGRWFLSWFGPSFVAGYPILVVLVIGQTVNAITGTIGVVLTMSGLERLVLKFHSYGLALTAAFCAALIPVWGPVGAAAGSAAANIFWNIALAVQLYRRLGISSCFCAPGFFRRGDTTKAKVLENTNKLH
jgi:O-antigen/teichoic acid export membrane protein